MQDRDMIINLTRSLLESIVVGNWTAYAEICDPSLTCFEPEARGHLVEGLDFHEYYFKLERSPHAHVQTTLASPHVRVMGEVAVISYVRFTQSLDVSGVPHTKAMEETRVWQKSNGVWKHVHFHRSSPS